MDSEEYELRKPDEVTYIPLWEVNHSKDRLVKEQKRDNSAYLLGYEMKEETDDPSKKAYKHFKDEYYPYGNVIKKGHEWDFDPKRATWMVADFNRRPHCWALMQIHTIKGEDVYVVFDQLFTPDALTTEQTELMIRLLQKWGIKKVILAGDNTSNQRSGNFGRFGKNDWDYVREGFKEAGIRWVSKLRTSNPRIKVRTDLVNKMIYNGLDEHGFRRMRFFVVDRATMVIKDYKFSITDEDGIKIDNGDRGHMSDGVDYGVYANEKYGKGIFTSIPRR